MPQIVPQIVPQSETITAITAYFSTSTALSLIGSTVTLQAQIYESAPQSNLFTPIPGAVVTLVPALTGIVPIGTVSIGFSLYWIQPLLDSARD